MKQIKNNMICGKNNLDKLVKSDLHCLVTPSNSQRVQLFYDWFNFDAVMIDL